MPKAQIFDWLMETLDKLGPEKQAKAGVYCGQTNEGEKRWEFIQLVDKDGKEQILNRFLAKTSRGDKLDYEIINDRGEKEQVNRSVRLKDIRGFAGRLLGQINHVRRTGETIPEVNFESTKRSKKATKKEDHKGPISTIGERVPELEDIKNALESEDSNNSVTEEMPTEESSSEKTPPVNEEIVKKEDNSEATETIDQHEQTQETEKKDNPEFEVGQILKLKESFRTDPSREIIELRKEFTDRFLNDLDENKRLTKLMESSFVIAELDREENFYAVVHILRDGREITEKPLYIRPTRLEQIFNK